VEPLAASGEVIVIDTMTAGLTGVTAGYLLPTPRPVLIECGPARSIAATIEALHGLGMDADDLAYLIVSHVHLDHAGGAGDLLAAFPQAKVVVSPRGAAHLSDPERLNASAALVYGELFDTVYGPCTPIDAARIIAPEHGELLDVGGGRHLEILDTPGHAKHHIGVFDPDLGALFTGDSVGIRLEGMKQVRPATPPSDFNFETMLASLELYRERGASTLYLAHFGDVGAPDTVLAEAEDRVRQWVAAAEAAWRSVPEHEDEVSHIAAMLEARFHEDVFAAPDADGETRRRIELLNGARSNATGLLRYLKRREAGTLTPLG
jgi:glyoxylase-like metal-dependent hydrolase (beta-lactamase superfamily II)